MPQQPYCARYDQSVPAFVYGGQSATMTVSASGPYDDAHLTPAGTATDGSSVVFTPPSATLTSSGTGAPGSPASFAFSLSATSTVNVRYTDHCLTYDFGRQDRQGSTTPETVRVVDGAPPSGPPCGAPDLNAIRPDRMRIAAGESVRLAVTIRTLPCYDREARPHRFHVVARVPGQTTQYPYLVVGEGQTDEYGHAQVTATPERDMRYDFVDRPDQGDSTVTVDRTAGACAGKVTATATAPASAPAGATSQVTGHSADRQPVTLHLRRRGQTAFTARAVHNFTTGDWVGTLPGDDDYRYYVTAYTCDSPVGLLQVHPTISGPTTARTGSTVTLNVHAPAGRGVAVYFRAAGGSYSLRRTGRSSSSGVFTTTYRADRDYRYYAVSTADYRRSSPGLTRVR